jgi:adenosine deaminase
MKDDVGTDRRHGSKLVIREQRTMDMVEFVRRLPKAELHLHLEGSVAASTLVDLANKHGVELPPFREPIDLYRYGNLFDFLKIYNIVCHSMRDAKDFHRVTYEALSRCANSGARYVEFFFSPHAHQEIGIAYDVMLDGILSGMRDVERDRAVQSRLIPAHSRELGPARGEQFLDMVLANRPDEVIGIGLDYNERPFPPAPFEAMYERARRAGLHVTAHAGEDGPAEYVRDSLHLLGVERVDHGYHIVDDPSLVAQCRERGVYFTVCPSTTLTTTVWKDLSAPDHAIKQMIDAGLQVMINSDDPPMFNTDLANEYVMLAERMKLDAAQFKHCALNGIRASWLDESVKREWISSWTQEIDGLMGRVNGR